MLSFWQNGKQIKIEAIYNTGQVGQVVIFDQRIYGEVKPLPTNSALSQYSCPSFFTILKKVEGKNGYYILRDSNGNFVKLQNKFYGAYENSLYDAQDWLLWDEMCKKEFLSRKEKKIFQLENQLELLKEILIKQGIHIITREQANNLELN